MATSQRQAPERYPVSTGNPLADYTTNNPYTPGVVNPGALEKLSSLNYTDNSSILNPGALNSLNNLQPTNTNYTGTTLPPELGISDSYTKNPSSVITSNKVADQAKTDIAEVNNVTSFNPKTELDKLVGTGQLRFENGQYVSNINGAVVDANGKVIKTGTPQDQTGAGNIIDQGSDMPSKGTKFAYDKDNNRVEVPIGADLTRDYNGMFSSTLNDRVPPIQTTTSVADEYADSKNKLASLQETIDSDFQGIIASIKASVDSSIKAQEEANQATEGGSNVIGITSGRSRYAPDIQLGIRKNIVDSGISKINDLKIKGESLIAEAKMAKSEADYKRLADSMTEYRANRKELFDQSMATQKQAYELEKAAQDKIKTGLEIQKLNREETIAQLDILAPAVIANMVGLNEEERQAYINQTAEESGGLYDSASLYKAVTDYENAQKAAQVKGITGDLADYNYLVSTGQIDPTKTSATAYMKSAANRKNVVASGTSNAANGLTYKDSIFGAISSLPVATQKNYLENYAQAKAAGDTEYMQTLVDQAALAGMNGSVKNSYMKYSSAANYAAKAVNSASDMLSALKPGESDKSIPYGVWSNITERQIKPIFGENPDPNLVNLISNIGLAQADLRNQIYGATITDNEMKTATEFFVNNGINYGDTIQSAMLKLNKMKDFASEKKNQLIDTYSGQPDTEIKVSDNAQKAIDLIKNNPNMTNEELAKKLNIKVTPTDTNTIRVKEISSGQTGTIPASEFDPTKYQKI